MWYTTILHFGIILQLNCYLSQEVQGISSYGLSFQEDGYMNDNSVNVWAKTKIDFPELTTFTICTWVKFTYERIFNQLWSYCVELSSNDGDTDLVCSSLSLEPGIFTQEIAGFGTAVNTTYQKEELFKQFRWNLICGSYLTQGEERLVNTLYFNGRKLTERLEDTPEGRNKWHAGGQWFLGQDQDTLGGSFEKQQSLSGTLSNVNIWDRILTDEEVHRMSKCFDSPLGSIFNWNAEESNWELSNVIKIELDTSDFCVDFPVKNYYMLPERRSLESGDAACNIMGGGVSIPLDKSENEKIQEIGDNFYKTCEANEQSGKTLWIGIERMMNDESDYWVNENQEKITYRNFRDGHGKGSDNCVFMLTRSGSSTGKWGSAQCSDQSPRRVCTLCEFNTKKTKFSLRGLCSDSRHDRTFVLEKNGTSKPYFKGLSTSIIKWNDNRSSWHLDHLRYNAEGFLFDETRVEYPIGRKSWKLDDRKCSLSDSETVLTLTSCSEDQFTCTDGTCISLKYRCDLKADCTDRSDEELCKKVIFPKDYEKDLAPKHTVNGQRVDTALPVYLSVDILSFDKIDTVNMMIGVMMRINITWKDRRIDYLNLRDDIYQNIVPDDEAQKVWIPEIGFDNAKTGKLEKDDHFALMVRRDSEHEPFNPSRHREDHVYQGYKNSLMYLRRYSAEYHCTFNLRFFPFDDQTCTMEFKARTVTKNYLQLVPGHLKYLGPHVLVEFIVANMTIEEGRDNVTRSEVKIEINFTRQYTYHLSQSYFQSFLLGFLAYLTFWIDVSNFTDRFMGSLTALLVLASLMSSLTTQLPKTSYFKIIDYWLLFFLISTSLNIAVHILVDRYVQAEQNKKVTKGVINAWMDNVNVPRKPDYDEPQLPIKEATPGHIALAATKGVKTIALQIGYKRLQLLDVKVKKPILEKVKSMFDGWTAQGINNFQKTLFPFLFLGFTVFYALASYYEWGNIDPENFEASQM